MIRRVPRAELAQIAPVFLAGLNRAFGEWGDERQFAWAFARAGEEPPAELFVAEEDGVPIAGIALVYRQIAQGAAAPRLMGCLSGAWALPDRLRKGLFGELCRTATARTLERGGAAAIAFIAGGRASAATVKAMSVSHAEGAAFEAPPGWAGAVQERLVPCDLDAAAAACLDRPCSKDTIGILHDAASWRRQMMDRPRPVSTFRLTDGTVAVIEHSVSAMCLLDQSSSDRAAIVRVFRALAWYANENGRSLSVNLFEPAAITALSALGLAPRTHRLFVFAAEPGFADAGKWRIANGDRM